MPRRLDLALAWLRYWYLRYLRSLFPVDIGAWARGGRLVVTVPRLRGGMSWWNEARLWARRGLRPWGAAVALSVAGLLTMGAIGTFLPGPTPPVSATGWWFGSDWGVVGDGVANDGPAIAALAARALSATNNKGGRIVLRPSTFVLGAAGSAATGLQIPQNVFVCGSSREGTTLQYAGDGIAVQTGAPSNNTWSAGGLEDLSIVKKSGASATVGLDLRNAQNGALVSRVRVGNTSDPHVNFATNALLVEDDTGTTSYPGFCRVEDCWFTGGATVVQCQTGTTTMIFENCGIDGDPATTVGFDSVLNPSAGATAAGCDLLLQGVKMELNVGATSSGVAGALAGAGAGNVDNGAHSYAVTFTLPEGETIRSPLVGPVTVVDKTTNGQVSLTGLPLGAGPNRYATARNVYRSAAGTTSPLKLLATIADNTTTAHTDNTADASLGASYVAGVGDAVGWQFDANCRIWGQVDARHTNAVSTKTAVLYTASPTSPPFPRMRLDLHALNFATIFSSSGLGLTSGFPMTENTAKSESLDFYGQTFKKRMYRGGNTLVSGNFALTGMGAGATFTPAGGSRDQGWGGTLTIGTAPGASPTLALTWVDGQFTLGAPYFIVVRNGGTGLLPFTWAEATATLTITLTGTPTAGETYIFRVLGLG